jgi:lipid-binding SYLF domain-containing protein
MSRFLAAPILVLLAVTAFASDPSKELDNSAVVIRNMTASHQIPSSLLGEAQCVLILPAVKQAAMIVGGKHGDGVVSCRTSKGWSAPAFLTISGGSVGLQAGFEHQDLVFLMNKQGEQELSRGEWSLGSDATAAGPINSTNGGPEANGWKTPVLVYTTSTGAYAGAKLEGSKISVDTDNMQKLYGPNSSLQTVLNGEAQTPGPAKSFLATLNEVTKQ